MPRGWVYFFVAFLTRVFFGGFRVFAAKRFAAFLTGRLVAARTGFFVVTRIGFFVAGFFAFLDFRFLAPAVGIPDGDHRRKDVVPGFRFHHDGVGEHAAVPANVP